MQLTDDFLYLPDAVLGTLDITPTDICDEIEKALIDKAEGRLITTPKSAIIPGGGRYMMSTLAVGDEGHTVLKTVAVTPENTARNLPSINGAILVLDANTGLLQAVMGANWITAHRTAALSAVAAKRLAGPDAASVGFIGCGTQALSHLAAFAALFPLQRVTAFGRGSANRDTLLETARRMGLEAQAAETPEDTLRESDLIVTSVTMDFSIEPFLDVGWLKPRAFAAITDACIPWHDEGLHRFGTIVVDDLDQERSTENPLAPIDMIKGDLTDLVQGKVSVEDTDAPNAFAFRGIALGDYAAATLAFRRAQTLGKGQRVAP